MRILIAVFALSLCLAASAQTGASASSGTSTNGTWVQIATDLGLTQMPTNIFAGPGITYSLSAKKPIYSLDAAWNLNGTFALGARGEYTGGKINDASSFSLFGGTVQLNHTFSLSALKASWSWLYVTPYATALVGTPVGGSGPDNGKLATEQITGFEISANLGKHWGIHGGPNVCNRQNTGIDGWGVGGNVLFSYSF